MLAARRNYGACRNSQFPIPEFPATPTRYRAERIISPSSCGTGSKLPAVGPIGRRKPMGESSATGGGLLRAPGLGQESEDCEHQRNGQHRRHAAMRSVIRVHVGQALLEHVGTQPRIDFPLA